MKYCGKKYKLHVKYFGKTKYLNTQVKRKDCYKKFFCSVFVYTDAKC